MREKREAGAGRAMPALVERAVLPHSDDAERVSATPSLPHDDDAERAVLGAILIDGSALDPTRGLLSPAAFYALRHGTIFRALCTLADAGSALDLVTLKSALAREGRLGECGGPAYLAGLLAGVPRSANVEHYARIVREKARRRAIVAGAECLTTAASNGTNDADLADLVRTTVESWGDERSRGVAFESAAEVLARPVPSIDWLAEGLIGAGDLGILSGTAGVGKSWLALHLLCALAAGVPIFGTYRVPRPVRGALLDLEDSSASIDGRLRRTALAVALDPEAASRLLVVRERLRLDDQAALARLLGLVGEQRIDLLVVDTLRRAFAGDENASAWSSALFRDALDPLRATGCAVLLLAHVRKKTGDADLDDPAQALRGSSDLLAMLDLHVGVEKRADGLAWIPTKLRHARLAEPLLLELHGLGDDEDAPVAITCRRGLDRASDAAQDAVVALLGSGELPRGEIIGRLSQFSDRGIDRALTSLKRRGVVTRRTVGRLASYALAGPTFATFANVRHEAEDVP